MEEGQAKWTPSAHNLAQRHAQPPETLLLRHDEISTIFEPRLTEQCIWLSALMLYLDVICGRMLFAGSVKKKIRTITRKIRMIRNSKFL
jgi:hypothetical protein